MAESGGGARGARRGREVSPLTLRKYCFSQDHDSTVLEWLHCPTQSASVLGGGSVVDVAMKVTNKFETIEMIERYEMLGEALLASSSGLHSIGFVLGKRTAAAFLIYI